MLRVTQLSGFGGGKGPPTALSFFNSAVNAASSAAGCSVTAPASISAGDLLLLACYASGGTFTVMTRPTGYTQLTSQATGNSVGQLSYKIADGSESSAAQVTSLNGTAATSDSVLVVLRPDNPIRSVALGVPDGQSSSTLAPGSFTLLPGALGTPAVVAVAWMGSGAVATRGMSPAKDGEIATAPNRLFVGWKFYNVGTTPVSNTVTSSDNGNDNITGGRFIQAA